MWRAEPALPFDVLPLDVDDFAEFAEVAAEAGGGNAVFHVNAVDEGGEGEPLAFGGGQIAGDGFAGAEAALEEQVVPGERAGLGLHVAFGGAIGGNCFGERPIDAEDRQGMFIDEEI